MKRLFKKIIAGIVTLGILFPASAFSAVTFPVNGGTGSTTLTGILKGNGTSPIQSLIVGSGLQLLGNTLSAISGGGGTVNSGTTGQDAFYASNGTAVSATSTIFISPASLVGISTTSPSAILDILSVSNNNTPLFNIASSTNGTGTTSAVYVAPNGQVGINALSTSSAQLTIFSSSAVATAGQSTLQIGSAITSGTVGSGPDLIFGNGTTINGNFKIQDGADAIGGGDTNLIFSGGGNNTPTEVFRMKYNGQIGVSTSTPWGTFAINPTAANSGGGPEFVVGSSTQTSFVVAANNDVGFGISTPTNTLSLFTVGSTAATSPTILFAASTTGAFSNHWIIGVDNSFAGDFVVASSSGTIGTNRTFVVDGNRSVGVGQVTASTLPDTFIVYPSLIPQTLGAEMELDGGGTVPPTTLGNFGGNMTLGTNMRARNVGGTGFVSVLNGPTTLITTVSSTGQMNFDFATTSAGTTISATNLVHFTLGLNTGAGLSTTTPYGGLDIATSTRPQLYLEDGLGTFGGYAFRSVGGYLYIGTTTPAEATSTPVEFTLASNGNVGIASSTPNSILSIGSGNGINFTSATSSFYTNGGLNLVSGGCYAISNVCIGGASGSGTVNSGLAGQNAYYASNGTTISATSTIFINSDSSVGISSTSPFAKFDILSTYNNNRPLLNIASSTNGTGTTSAFFVAANGSVGINTNTPTATLDVKGIGSGNLQNLVVESDPGDSGSGGINSITFSNTDTTNYKNQFSLRGGNPAVEKYSLGNDVQGNAGDNFYIYQASSGRTALFIDSNGNLQTMSTEGIGFNNSTTIGTSGSIDTMITRDNGGIFDFGNGNNKDKSGTLLDATEGIASSSPGTILSVGNTNGINFSTGTSTFSSTGGINLTSGCFAIASTCLSSGGSSLTGSTGQVAYFSGTNTAVGTSSLFIASTGNVGIATTTPTAPLTVVANALGGLLINTWTNITNAFSVVNNVGATVFNIDTTSANPFLGVATTTPFGTISAVGNGTNPVLAIASSTIGLPNFEVDKTGFVTYSGAAPTLSSCGTSVLDATTKSNDAAGEIDLAGTALTSCTINFAITKVTPPVCTVSDNTTASVADITSISTTQLVIGLSVGISTAKVWYQCSATQ